MNRFEYIVESIDGDYAHLRRTDIESDELKLRVPRSYYKCILYQLSCRASFPFIL